MSISWFITKAHLANLYYTTDRNYSATEETCNEIIVFYKQSHYNQLFAEFALPIVLSTQLTSIYDKELQEMLGLFSLCSFIFYKTDRRHSVYLGACPVQFALYLKWRCAVDQLLLDRMNGCLYEYVEHLKVCECDQRVNNGIRAIRGVLPLTVVQWVKR